MKIKYFRRKLRKTVKNFKNLVYWAVFAVLTLSGLIILLSSFNTPLSLKILTVQSGSMEPKISTGSVIIVKPQSDYQIEDVITFHSPDQKKETITHRIVGLTYSSNNNIQFVTKGDANEDRDSEKVDQSRIIGKTILTIPLLGYLITFIRTPVGTIFLVVIPATLFVVQEILSIKKEIRIMRRRKAII